MRMGGGLLTVLAQPGAGGRGNAIKTYNATRSQFWEMIPFKVIHLHLTTPPPLAFLMMGTIYSI